MVAFQLTPEKALTRTNALETSLAQMEGMIATLRREYSEACLNEADGVPGAKDTVVKTEQALQRAEAEYDRTETALFAARTRHSELTRAIEAQKQEEKWDAAERMFSGLELSGTKLEKLSHALIEEYRSVVEAGKVLNQTVPVSNNTIQQAGLHEGALEMHLRIHLRKAGWNWAMDVSPFTDLRTVPSFSQRISEGVKLLLSQRDAQKNS